MKMIGNKVLIDSYWKKKNLGILLKVSGLVITMALLAFLKDKDFDYIKVVQFASLLPLCILWLFGVAVSYSVNPLINLLKQNGFEDTGLEKLGKLLYRKEGKYYFIKDYSLNFEDFFIEVEEVNLVGD